jgi:hypothetical protein
MKDDVLCDMRARFSRSYAKTGRPPIAPERLLRALLLQVLYSVRSERLLMEQLGYSLLFRWFVGLNLDAPTCDAACVTGRWNSPETGYGADAVSDGGRQCITTTPAHLPALPVIPFPLALRLGGAWGESLPILMVPISKPWAHPFQPPDSVDGSGC